MPTPPDVLFPTYTFRANTDTSYALRSPRDRIADEISVREFGAVDTPTNCRLTLQAALNSGKNLYFPQGIYTIDSPIGIPNDNCRRSIRGAGPNGLEGSSNGTAITGNFRDYLWKTDQNYGGFSSITSI